MLGVFLAVIILKPLAAGYEYDLRFAELTKKIEGISCEYDADATDLFKAFGLLEKLWDADGNFVDEHALTAAISRVRNKIETPGRQYIKTVYGMGYMWIGGALK